MKKITRSILPIVALVILWEVACHLGLINCALFPPPSKVAMAFFGLVISSTLLADLATSLWRLVVGLLIGALSGIIVGLITGRTKSIDKIFTPVIQLLRPLPPVAIIPLIIIWFGIGDGAKIISIAFAVFFPVWVNTHIGAEQIPKIYLWSAKLLTASRMTTFRKIILPSALPNLFKGVIVPASISFIIAGVRIGIAIAFIMVFVSELSGASSGIGYRISVSFLTYRIDSMLAALMVLGALGALTDRLFVCLVRKLFPWLIINSK